MTFDLKKIEALCNRKFILWMAFLAWILFITNLWLPRNWGFYGGNDWDLTYATFESARKSIVEYGQWPAFNPYLAFGSDFDSNPQSGHISIFFIPVLLFGAFYGYKVSIILAIFIGLNGFRSLMLKTGANATSSTLSALFFCSVSYFSRHIMEAGHSNFLYFFLVPHLFVFLENLRTEKKLVYGFFSSLILAQFVLGGAPLVFITAAIMMLIWALYLAISKINTWQWLLKNIGILLFALGLSLWKLLPVLSFWNQSPRIVSDESGINPLVFLDAIADFKIDTRTPHDWHEFSIGLGLIAILLIFFYRKHITNFKTWIVLLIPVVWLCLGNMPPYFNPWYILHHYFPFFNGLRAPSRFSFILIFTLSIGIGIILKKEYHNNLLIIVITGLILSNTLSFNAVSHSMVFSKRMETPLSQVNQAPVLSVKSDKKNLYDHVAAGHLVLDAYEPQHLPEVKDTLKNFVQGAVVINFSPNKINLETLEYQTVLNLRHSKYWHSDELEVKEKNGLIYLEGAPGKKVTLKYDNPLANQSFKISAILFAIGLIFSIAPRTLKKM